MNAKIETSVNELAIITVNGFKEVNKRLDKINGHIGRYEIRAQNIEKILLKDHKPRIAELEKLAFVS